MTRRQQQREASTIVFLDLAFGEEKDPREERRARWNRRKAPKPAN